MTPQKYMYATLRAAAFVGMDFHHGSALVQCFYLSERRLAVEVADGGGMVQTRDSLGKDLLALDNR